MLFRSPRRRVLRGDGFLAAPAGRLERSGGDGFRLARRRQRFAGRSASLGDNLREVIETALNKFSEETAMADD